MTIQTIMTRKVVTVAPEATIADVIGKLYAYKGNQERAIIFGDLEVDPSRRSVKVAGLEVTLTASEFDVLATLVSSPGLVFTRLQLLESVMGFDYDGLERTIDAHVKNLRRKLGDDAKNPRYIATVVGVGYKAPRVA